MTPPTGFLFIPYARDVVGTAPFISYIYISRTHRYHTLTILFQTKSRGRLRIFYVAAPSQSIVFCFVLYFFFNTIWLYSYFNNISTYRRGTSAPPTDNCSYNYLAARTKFITKHKWKKKNTFFASKTNVA